MKYTFQKLPYSYDAFEPHIDAKTMEIHHSKHHQAYVDKLNAILEKYPQHQELPLENLLMNIQVLRLDEKDKTALKNQAGGVYNHGFFWSILSPKKEIDTKLADEITTTFLSMENFKKIFSEIALGHFGSGWVWLCRNESNNLVVYSLPNQDTPLALGHTPIFRIDVWEHAYYLKYQNRRAEYIDNWWHVLKMI